MSCAARLFRQIGQLSNASGEGQPVKRAVQQVAPRLRTSMFRVLTALAAASLLLRCCLGISGPLQVCHWRACARDVRSLKRRPQG